MQVPPCVQARVELPSAGGDLVYEVNSGHYSWETN